MAQEQPAALQYERPTGQDLRAEIRTHTPTRDESGRKPLRKMECLAAYAELADEPLDGDVTVGEARYRLVEQTDHEDRNPFDASSAFSRSELLAIREALSDV